MIKLNLIATGIEQEKIKEYLENNASETLANKINNGVKITKDNKTLINKKDLNGFWKYATNEARKLSENNTRGAYVDDETVYSWAIHYFEEESIEGNLLNEDGTEYKVIKTATPSKSKQEIKKEKPNDNLQTSLFDFLDTNIDDEHEENEESEQENLINLPPEEKDEENLIIDIETGEILTHNEQLSSFDDEVTTSLFSIFQNNLEVK